MHETFKALVATNDAALMDRVTPVLQRLHFDVIGSRDEDRLIESLRTESPDMLLIDYELPRLGGPELFRRLRKRSAGAKTPVIAMTDRGEPREEIEALEAGADDCVGKPPDAETLAAHVKALARRTLSAAAADNRLRAGPIEMDLARWTVYVNGAPVSLTRTEFKLLQTLVEARGRTLTREYLLRKVWLHPNAQNLNTKTVDVHVGRLRRKLDRAGGAIVTVRNVGFRFELIPEWVADTGRI